MPSVTVAKSSFEDPFQAAIMITNGFQQRERMIPLLWQEADRFDPRSRDVLLLCQRESTTGAQDACISRSPRRTSRPRTQERVHRSSFENHLPAKMNPEIDKLLHKIGQHLQLGRIVPAEQGCHDVLVMDPGCAQAWFTLGRISEHNGKLAEATECYEKAVLNDSNLVPAYFALGNILWVRGKAAEALSAFETALALQPRQPEIEFRLAIVLNGMRRHEDALAIYRSIEARVPDFPSLHNNIGIALMKMGRCDEAIASYERALKAAPNDYMALNNLGNALRVQQRFEESIECFRRLLKIHPLHSNAHANLLLTMNYTEMPQAEIFAESLRFGERQCGASVPGAADFENPAEPSRRLKIAYVSPDFRSHSVTSFLIPVLQSHDRAQFEVFCYSNCAQTDATTDYIEGLSDHWCSIVGWTDDDVAKRIRDDCIDILVDLAGHTGLGSLTVFARKPAPLQVSWLGYPNTTGLPTIDYRLTDAVADPIGPADDLHSEKLVRLEHGFLCYRADASTSNVAPAPVAKRGYVTFGSFNALAKIRPPVVRAWSEIMQAVPHSRLVLKANTLSDPVTRNRFIDMFAAHGIEADRLELLGWMKSRAEHMATYAKIDVGLDTFPYNGTTTTCEALWMGVPVVTLSGDRHASRVGASIMERIGLGELVAESEQKFIALATELGSDPERLVSLRSGLRDRMSGSTLTDAALITAGIESAFREMWRRWCEAAG